MKVRFKKRGLLSDHYIIVEHCCDQYHFLKKIAWDRKRSTFFADFTAGNGIISIRMNYCSNCGAKTVIVDESGNIQPLPIAGTEENTGTVENMTEDERT